MKVITLFFLFLSFLTPLQSQTSIADNSDWINTKTVFYTYDDAGLCINRTEKQWDLASSDWMEKVQCEWSYDSNGNKEEYSIFKYKEGLESWEKTFHRKAFSSEPDTKSSEVLYRLENKRTAQWELNSKTVSEHLDADGKSLIQNTTLVYIANAWSNRTRTTTAHVSNEKTVVNQVWDKELNDWKYTTKNVQLFNEKQTAVKFSFAYKWSQELNDWKPTSKAEITQIGKNSEYQVLTTWDDKQMAWIKTSQTYYFYDVKGQIKEVIYQHLSDENRLVNTSRIQYHRNSKGESIKELHQNAVPKTAILANRKLGLSNFKCFLSNPYLPGTAIQLVGLDINKKYEISVHNIEGQLFFKKSIDNLYQFTFSLDNKLSAGSYILSVKKPNDRIYNRKIIVQ